MDNQRGLRNIHIHLLPSVAVFVALLITACGQAVMAPIGKDPRVSDIWAQSAVSRTTTHIVKKGETLYSIAFAYGLNFREVANWNNISSPFVIYPGQRLNLVPSVRVATKPASSTQQTDQGSNSSTTENSALVAKQESATDSSTANKQVSSWVWPVKGPVVKTFKQTKQKGIDISGELGQLVRASADGNVVYSGGGLIGYGELIIIKHNKNYLSAYGHNKKLLVKQGDFVKSGQQIATMGLSGTDEVKLHFEIRRDGKPVDPIRYLPN